MCHGMVQHGWPNGDSLQPWVSVLQGWLWKLCGVLGPGSEPQTCEELIASW